MPIHLDLFFGLQPLAGTHRPSPPTPPASFVPLPHLRLLAPPRPPPRAFPLSWRPRWHPLHPDQLALSTIGGWTSRWRRKPKPGDVPIPWRLVWSRTFGVRMYGPVVETIFHFYGPSWVDLCIPLLAASVIRSGQWRQARRYQQWERRCRLAWKESDRSVARKQCYFRWQ